MANKTIGEVATDVLITINLNQSVIEAAQMMRKHDIGFLPVMNGSDFVGVVTDRDLVLRIFAEQRPPETQIKEVMSAEIRSIDKDVSIQDAAIQMAKWKVRRLAVTSSGKLCGVVAIGDLAVREESDQMAGDALQRISSKQ